MPVRRAASSTEASSNGDSDGARLWGAPGISSARLWPNISQRRPWGVGIRTAGMLKSACVLYFAVEEIAQKGANCCDGSEATDLVPIRRERGANDVSGQLKRERRAQPSRDVEPHSPPIRTCHLRRPHDPNDVASGFHHTRGNDDDSNRLGGECDRMSDCM